MVMGIPSGTLQLITRLIKGALDAINRVKARKAAENPADTISNGGVQHELDVNMADKLRDRKDQ